MTPAERVQLLEEMVLTGLSDVEIIKNFRENEECAWDADDEEIQLSINLARDRIADTPNAEAHFLKKKLLLEKDWKGAAQVKFKPTGARVGLYLGFSTAHLLGYASEHRTDGD
jgi:hypothetical protein